MNYRHIRSVTNYLIKALLLISIVASTGCIGTWSRSLKTGPTYEVSKEKIQDPAPDKGRLFVYLVDGGPGFLSAPGGNEKYCTVDDKIYKVLGESYWFVDLDAGHHKVTSPAGGILKLKYGKYSAEFELLPGEVKYCKIDASGFAHGITWEPTMVEATVAEKELSSLPFFEYKTITKDTAAGD